MTGPRATRSTHERNLERSLERDLVRRHPVEGEVQRAGPPAASPREDVAGRLARDAAEREVRRRARERLN